MTYRVTAKDNFSDGLVRVWEYDNYEDARKCAQKKAAVHKRMNRAEKLYLNVTVRDENGIKCSY